MEPVFDAAIATYDEILPILLLSLHGPAVGPVLRASGIVNPPVGVMRFANVFKKLAEAFLTWHVAYFSA